MGPNQIRLSLARLAATDHSSESCEKPDPQSHFNVPSYALRKMLSGLAEIRTSDSDSDLS
jgi:hypothetical protein